MQKISAGIKKKQLYKRQYIKIIFAEEFSCMTAKKYKYIFWDMDGTIINSYPGVIESALYALNHFGLTETNPENLRMFIGPPLRVTFGEIYHMNEAQIETAVAKYRENYNAGGMFKCEVFPGVVDAMDALKKAGYKQLIASSKPEHMCRLILERFDLLEKMDDVVGASLDGKRDTKIQVLEEAFRRLDNPDKHQVVLIGDTKYDAIGAAQMGIDCIGITYGFGTKEELEKHGAKMIFSTIEEVIAYLSA